MTDQGVRGRMEKEILTAIGPGNEGLVKEIVNRQLSLIRQEIEKCRPISTDNFCNQVIDRLHAKIQERLK